MYWHSQRLEVTKLVSFHRYNNYWETVVYKTVISYHFIVKDKKENKYTIKSTHSPVLAKSIQN
jgi:hypothetical protein